MSVSLTHKICLKIGRILKLFHFLLLDAFARFTWALVMVTCRHVQSSNSFHTYEFKAPLK